MDDNFRLIKLLSLVSWAHPTDNRCGLRYQDNADRDLLDEQTGVALHQVCMWYACAVEHHRGANDSGHALDARQLPERTLEAVTTLPTDVIDLLGAMVKGSLGLGDRADAAALGRLWLDDVT